MILTFNEHNFTIGQQISLKDILEKVFSEAIDKIVDDIILDLSKYPNVNGEMIKDVLAAKQTKLIVKYA